MEKHTRIDSVKKTLYFKHSVELINLSNYSIMLELNVYNIIYLTFRLLPIILPSYFILSSIFSQDIKGIIYLAGLLIASFLTVLFANSVDENFFKLGMGMGIDGASAKCNLISLNGVNPVSKVPLSQTVYAYTLFYLAFIIGKYSDHKKNNLWIQNLPTILFLSVIVVADIFWNLSNNCSSMAGILISLFVGGTFGLIWAWIIDSSGAVQLQYFNGLSNRTYCTRPSKQLFKCK